MPPVACERWGHIFERGVMAFVRIMKHVGRFRPFFINVDL